jgi:hypothetical protein
MFIEFHLPVTHFTNFKCNITVLLRHTMQFFEDAPHHSAPFIHRPRHGDGISDRFRIDTVEPAAQLSFEY